MQGNTRTGTPMITLTASSRKCNNQKKFQTDVKHTPLLCTDVYLKKSDFYPFDWFTVILQGGFHSCEYYQLNYANFVHEVEICDFETPKAFIAKDIQFFTECRIQIKPEYTLNNMDSVAFIKVWFYWQKNGKQCI